MQVSETLKPCPFCGGSAELDYSRRFRAISSGNIEKAVAVYCVECNADMTLCRSDHPGFEKDELAFILTENWNRRAALAHGEPVEKCGACDGTGQDLETVNPVTLGPIDCDVCKGTGFDAPQPSGPVEALAEIDRHIDAAKRMANAPCYKGSFPAHLVIQTLQELRDAVASALTAGGGE